MLSEALCMKAFRTLAMCWCSLPIWLTTFSSCSESFFCEPADVRTLPGLRCSKLLQNSSRISNGSSSASSVGQFGCQLKPSHVIEPLDPDSCSGKPGCPSTPEKTRAQAWLFLLEIWHFCGRLPVQFVIFESGRSLGEAQGQLNWIVSSVISSP